MPRCPTDSARLHRRRRHRADTGVAPNALTSADWCDSYAGRRGTKHVPARIEAVAPTLSVV